MPNISLDHIELRSEEVQEIITKVPHWIIRWGNVLFLAIILMLLLLSCFVKYPDIIVSEVTITTETPPQKEYAEITGDFETILVENNQEVSKNQVLAILENTANYLDVYKLKSVIDTITVDRKSFSFPIDSLPILFLGNIESQFAQFQNSYIKYKLNKDFQPFANEIKANRYTVSELKKRLQSLKSQRDINKTELDFMHRDLNRQKHCLKKVLLQHKIMKIYNCNLPMRNEITRTLKHLYHKFEKP